MKSSLILISSQNAVWRGEQIAGAEVVECTLSLFIVGTPMTEDARRDYEYDSEQEAQAALLNITEALKRTLE